MTNENHTVQMFDPDNRSKRIPINWDEPLVYVSLIYMEAYPVVYHDRSCLGADVHLIVYKKNGASASYIALPDGTSALAGAGSAQRVYNVSSIPKIMLAE